jgi:hypothetical protein
VRAPGLQASRITWNPVGRVPSRGAPRVFQQPARLAIYNSTSAASIPHLLRPDFFRARRCPYSGGVQCAQSGMRRGSKEGGRQMGLESLAKPMRSPCDAHAMPMRCPCDAHAMPMRCPCEAHAMPMRCPCDAHAMPMRCPCDAHAMPMRCPCDAHANITLLTPGPSVTPTLYAGLQCRR